VKAGFRKIHKEGDLNSVKKTVLTFGLISGAISAVMMLVTIPVADRIGWEKGEIFG
jgi:hypothetical protein